MLRNYYFQIIQLQFVILIFPIYILGQSPPSPDILDTFGRHTVVPYQYDQNNQILAIQGYNINNAINQRNDALDFYNLLVDISEPSTLSIFTNYTYNINNYSKKPFILDANLQIPIALGGKKWISNGRMLHSLHVIPQFKVRIFMNDRNAPGDPYGIIQGDESLPVRTPSYIPRLTYYFTWRNLFRDSTQHGPGSIYNRSLFFGFSAFHHSNGQDGPEFYDDPSINVSNAEYGDINVYNGNFGENLAFELISGGVIEYRSRRQIQTNRRDSAFFSLGDSRSIRTNYLVDDYPFNRRWYWRASFEFHLPGLTNKDFAEYDLYGRYRLNLQSGFSWIPAFRDLVLGQRNNQYHWVQTTPYQPKEAWRLVGNIQYILDPVYNDGNLLSQSRIPFLDLKRLNIYATLFWRMTGSPNSALFFQTGYWGSDNYNIYFKEQIIQLRIGAAFAFFKYPKLADFQREPLSR